MVRKDSANYSKGKLAVGYGVIALLIGAIVYLYISEWRQLEKLEQEVKHINVLRQKVHDAYAKKLELAMHGETILEWEATDTIRYRTKRLSLTEKQLKSLISKMEKNDFIERSGGGKYVQYSKTDKFPSFKGGPQD